ncbi:MAG: hypothetical protein ACTSPV_14300 [Candidatus Hodarchaeales archaeon]
MVLDKTPRIMFDDTEGVDMKKGVTLVVCFSRRWCIHNFFACMTKLKLPDEPVHLLMFDNNESVLLFEELSKEYEKYKGAFASARYYKSFRTGGALRSEAKKSSYKLSKLPKIYAMHRDVIKMLTTERFVMLEDDTLFPGNCMVKLLKLIDNNNDVGIAIGISTGRSPTKHIPTRLGVHYLEMENGFIRRRISPRDTLKGIYEVDCCGWYCFASYKTIWAKGFVGMSKYLHKIPRFALDNYHTYNIHKMGYKILADFSIWTKHMNANQDRILFWTKGDAVPMLDIWLPEFNVYAQGVRLIKGQDTKYLRKWKGTTKK